MTVHLRRPGWQTLRTTIGCIHTPLWFPCRNSSGASLSHCATGKKGHGQQLTSCLGSPGRRNTCEASNPPGIPPQTLNELAYGENPGATKQPPVLVPNMGCRVKFPSHFLGSWSKFRPTCAPRGVVTLVIGPLPMRFWRFLRQSATETGQSRVSKYYRKTKLEPNPGK